MGITSEKINETTARIKVQGEFEKKTCMSIKQELLELIADEIKDIYIDLSDSDFIDGVGIGLLLSTNMTLNKSGGSLIIENPKFHIVDLFEATQTNQFLKLSQN